MDTSRLNLAWGTNELPELHPYWKKWLHQAQADSIFQPSGFFGSPELRKAISERYHSRYHLSKLGEQDITITNGGTEALYTAFQWIKSIQGCVIIQQPSWGYFKDALRLLQIPFFESYAKESQGLTDDLEKIDYPGPKLFLLTNPSNPESHLFSEAYLQTLSDWAHSQSHHYVLSDEIYDWYASAKDGYRSWTEVHGLDSSIIVEGYSKPTGLAAFRVGYFICAPDLSRDLRTFHMHTTYGISSLSNAIALEAQREENTIRALLIESLDKRRAFVKKLWSAHPEHLQIPNTGMYVMVDWTASEEQQKTFLTTLLKEHEIMVTPAASFGRKQSGMRLNICRSLETLEEAIPVIAEEVSKHFTIKN